MVTNPDGKPLDNGSNIPQQTDAERQTFVELYHWCDTPNGGWDRQVDVAAFQSAFASHLAQMGEQTEARRFVENAAPTIVHRAQRICLRLAMQTGELPSGWDESMTGLPSVLIPPHPLRAIGDFKEWFGGILQSLPLPGSDQYNYPATALMLWDHYRRAKAWLSQHEFEVPSIDPAEYGRARAWMSSRQGDSPATRQAHQALAELVNGLQTPPAAPSSEAKPVDEKNYNTNERMMVEFTRDQSCISRTAEEWGDLLEVEESTIRKTATWIKVIQSERERSRNELRNRPGSRGRKVVRKRI